MYFRVTDEEFHQLERCCQQEGARSLSEFVRGTVQRLLAKQEDAAADPVALRVQALDDLAEQLARTVEQLTVIHDRQKAVPPVQTST